MTLLIEGIFVSCHRYMNYHDVFIVDMKEIRKAITFTEDALTSDGKICSRKVYQGVVGLLMFHLIYLIIKLLYANCQTGYCRTLCFGTAFIFRMCVWCFPTSKKTLIEEASAAILELFPDDSFIASDAIAAMTCIYAKTKIQQDQQMIIEDNNASKYSIKY